MEFYIRNTVVGTKHHLHCREDGVIKEVSEIPEEILCIGTKEFWTLVKLYNLQIPSFPPEPYKKIYRQLCHIKRIPWALAIPHEKFTEYLYDYVSQMKKVLEEVNPPDYFNNYFAKQEKLFACLKPAKINSSAFSTFAKKKSLQRTTVLSFFPVKGFAKPPIYDRVNSKTGRLTTLHGPMILTIKKSIRAKLVESRFGKDGNVWELDYTSVEPRILLEVNNKRKGNNEPVPKDIYLDLIQKMDLNVSRDAVKTAILTRLFGGGDALVAEKLKEHNVEQPYEFLDVVDDYFGIQELRQELLSEYSKSGGRLINNFYGRPIHCEGAEPYVLLNYFVQSSAVDAVLLGFNRIVDRLQRAEILDFVVPLFVLHDALWLDVHKKYEHLMDKICKAGSTGIPLFENTNFYLQKQIL